jgi:hypothetical protein
MAEHDGRLLAVTTANEDVMDIDIVDRREYYETLMCNAMSVFQQFPLSIETQNTYTQGRLFQLVKNFKPFRYEIWIAIGGLQNVTNSKGDALSNLINRIKNDVWLLKVGED